HRSSGMLLPSSHSSLTSTTALPQQPSPGGQSLALSHSLPLIVQFPTTWQFAEQRLNGPPLALPRSHSSKGGVTTPSPQLPARKASACTVGPARPAVDPSKKKSTVPLGVAPNVPT